MDRAVFDRMAEQDAEHWWYVARRRYLSALIERQVPMTPGARVLEVGCGTGHNLEMLGRFGHVDALELDAPARAIAERRLGRPIGAAPLPQLPGVPDRAYQLIALLDVLEHVEDGVGALRALREKLAADGRLLVAVPANPWMWSAHDVHHHHHRRYTAGALRREAAEAGLAVDHLSHFNSLLFPVAAAARIAGKITNKQTADDAMPSPPVNRLLAGIFGLERFVAGRVPLPFGVSIAAVMRAR